MTWRRSSAPRTRAPLAATAALAASAAALALAACRAKAPPPAPDVEAGAICADVGTLRVCWRGGEARVREREPVREIERPPPVPDSVPSPMGWRCVGAGAARRCASRADRAPLFVCAGDLCEQRHPRMPDDGEWQCADSAGATICMGGERAAGVAPAPPDPGWLCGARRGDPRARVCVDLSPDFPDGHARGWRCRTRYDGAPRRLCKRDPDAHALADACDGAHPCVDGSRCAGGWCVPPPPAPACWLDSDCGGGRCQFGSCVGGGA